MQSSTPFVLIAGAVLLSVAGLQSSPVGTAEVARRGVITGQVRWQGAQPTNELFVVRTHRHFTRNHMLGRKFDNPNRARIEPKSGGVDGAIIYLAAMRDDAAAWRQPRVRVEQRDFALIVRQGDQVGNVGLVRKGEEVELISHDDRQHVVQGRGAAFFSLPFVDRNRVSTRRLTRPGLVELSSGMGYYWMRGYLFVCDHPYYTRTDAQGRFQLRDVPPGDHAIICWMPNWKVRKHYREPEAGLINQLVFAEPMQQELRVQVEPGVQAHVDFTVYQQLFQ